MYANEEASWSSRARKLWQRIDWVEDDGGSGTEDFSFNVYHLMPPSQGDLSSVGGILIEIICFAPGSEAIFFI